HEPFKCGCVRRNFAGLTSSQIQIKTRQRREWFKYLACHYDSVDVKRRHAVVLVEVFLEGQGDLLKRGGRYSANCRINIVPIIVGVFEVREEGSGSAFIRATEWINVKLDAQGPLPVVPFEQRSANRNVDRVDPGGNCKRLAGSDIQRGRRWNFHLCRGA